MKYRDSLAPFIHGKKDGADRCANTCQPLTIKARRRCTNGYRYFNDIATEKSNYDSEKAMSRSGYSAIPSCCEKKAER